jgi:hypothetical protein
MLEGQFQKGRSVDRSQGLIMFSPRPELHYRPPELPIGSPVGSPARMSQNATLEGLRCLNPYQL